MGGRERELAQVLGDLALEMQGQSDTESTLQSIVTGAVAVVPGVRWAGISLIEGPKVKPRVPSDPIVAKLDAIQSELNEGPCLSALREHRTVLIDDMAAETRWPRYCETAMDIGARSLLSFRLFVQNRNLGALNLYASEAGVFADEPMLIGEIVAQHASVALIGAAAEASFDAALSSRDVIGQAKGIIMERFRVNSTAAFSLLTRLSQESNTKIVDIARDLVATIDGDA
ncbi:GAF and ANTAR domain-containing protein [Mycobacterium sp. 236(2023)]|uniref:GAF and ANTAR domain-containing protein n=1 Tax=Mycobacterium sp. 236(2023) TaxID=3038163 RepID=UPI0024153A46|nr:GAF and ANTAR domain-containing protein [Mycobacterium sp. 236(2023)]MDG4667974.1 GAF and ANTAR domain-containing protein [Mycobacterium sp. 236(2023)]